MKGMSFRVKQAEVREERLIDHIDNKHIYCRYEHQGRRVFVLPETINRKDDKGVHYGRESGR
jgi:hypothetical protein